MAFGQDDDDNDYPGKPVEEGETYEVEIDDLGSKGDGIARVDGFVVFVPETEVGEKVEVEINSVGRRFAFGEVVDRLGTVEEDGGETDAPAAVEEATDTVEEAPAEEPAEAPAEAAAPGGEEDVSTDGQDDFLDEPEPEEAPDGGDVEEHDPYGLDEDEKPTDEPAGTGEPAAEDGPEPAEEEDDYDKEEVEEAAVEEDLDAELEGDPAEMEELEERVEEALADDPGADEPMVCEDCGAEIRDPATHECA